MASQQVLTQPAARNPLIIIADLVAVVSAAVILLAFRFLPWTSTGAGTPPNGAEVFSITLSPLLLLVPAFALFMLLLGFWGLITPSARRGIGWVVALLGGLIIAVIVVGGVNNAGLGVWLTIAASVTAVIGAFLPADTSREAPKALRTWLTRTPEASALIGFLVVFLFFSATSTLFFAPETASTVLVSQATTGIAAVGITMLMISGEFDLSVGSTLAVSTLTFLSLISTNVPAPLAAIVGVLVGMLLGLINGLLLVWTRIPSFIVTLGTLQAYRAIALTGIRGGKVLRYYDYFSDPPWVYFHPLVLLALAVVVIGLVAYVAVRSGPNILRTVQQSKGFTQLSAILQAVFLTGMGLLIVIGMGFVGTRFLGSSELVRVNFFDILNGKFDFIPDSSFRMSMVWWALIVAVFTIVLGQTRYGNAVYATGGNAGAARAQGIPVDSVRIFNFVISGALAAVAGVIAAGRELAVFPLQAQGLELEVIAASVIGGTLLTGGYGSIIGALLGVLITGMLRSGLVQLQVAAELFQGAIGVILIVTVVVNTAVRGQGGSLNIRWLQRFLPRRS